MEGIVTQLSNLGGLGVLAAALLYLHITSLRAFRDELAAERAGFEKRNQAIVDAIQAQTRELGQQFAQLAESIREVERRAWGRTPP